MSAINQGYPSIWDHLITRGKVGNDANYYLDGDNDTGQNPIKSDDKGNTTIWSLLGHVQTLH